MKYLPRLFGVLLTLCFLIPTMVAIDVESTDDADAVFQLLKETENQFKDHDLVTVFDYISTEYVDSGAAVTEEEVLLHYRKGSAAASMRSLHYEYNPRTANIEFLEVKIYKADNKTVENIPMESIFIDKAPADSIFWNFDAVVCPIPRLEDGDALYYKIKRQGLNLAYLQDIVEEDFRFVPPQEGYFMDTLYFQERHPIIEKTYDITGPKSKPLQFTMANGSLNTTVRFSENQWFYTFSAKNVDAWIEEPHDDGYAETTLKLALASHPSWESKSKWAYEHNEPQFIISDEIREKTMEVIAGCSDRECKMFRLLHWVAEEIRYLGLDMGEGEGHMVHTTDSIFSERAGVCKDKAAILVSMLRAAGFESYFVMTLAMEETLDLPADDKFNHGVVAVRNDDGTWTFLDPTWAPQNRPLFNYSEQEQPVLIAAPEGVDLMHVPYSPPEESPFRVTAETTLMQNGHATTEMFIETDGYVDGRFRSMLSWMTPSYRTQFFQSIVADLSPLAELTELQFSHPLDFDQPLQMKLIVNIPNAAEKIGETLYLNPILTRHLWSSRWGSRYLHAASGPEKRQHGLELSCTRHVLFDETIHLPKGFVLKKTPEKVDIKGDTIDTSFMVETGKRNTINIKQVIDIKRRVTPAKEYPEVRKTIEKINELRDTLLILETNGKRIVDPKTAHVKGTVKPHETAIPDHGAIIHDRLFEITFDKNKIIERFRTESTVFTDDARSALADNSYIYLDDSQTVEVVEAYTLTTDGRRIDSPPSAINRTLALEVYEAPDYKNLKNLTVSHIGVEYGHRLIHEVIRTTNLTETDSATNFGTLFIPVQEYPVEACQFIVHVPVDGDIVFETSKIDSVPDISNNNGVKTYKWTFENIAASYSESHMGSYYATVPIILVAEQAIASWETQIESIRSMVFPEINPETSLKEMLDDILKNAHSNREKLMAISDYVHANVNPVSINPRRFLYRTRSPEQVINTGYGYSLERAALINALVELAGGRTYVGFSGDSKILQSNVPAMRMLNDLYFSMMLDGDHVILDESGRAVAMSRWLEKRNVWISKEDHFWQEPVTSSIETDRINMSLNLEIGEKDAVTGSLDVTWAGLLNTGYQAQNKTDMFIKRVISEYVSDAKTSEINVLAMNVEDGQTRIQCKFEGKLKPEEFGEDLLMVNLPSCSHGFSSDRYRLNQKKGRIYPFHLERAGVQHETIRITYPESWKPIKLPGNINMENNAGSYLRNIIHEDNSITLERTFTLPRLVIEPEDYRNFLKLHQFLINDTENIMYFQSK